MSTRTFLSALLPLFVLLHLGIASATTLYVDVSVTAPGDGASWETAFKTIQEGIDVAFYRDTVLVAQGNYVENIHLQGKSIRATGGEPAPSRDPKGREKGAVPRDMEGESIGPLWGLGPLEAGGCGRYAEIDCRRRGALSQQKETPGQGREEYAGAIGGSRKERYDENRELACGTGISFDAAWLHH